jgi:hypothetical protein
MRHASRGNRKCTEAATQVHTGTIATRQRHLSASYHSRGHGVLVFNDQYRSTPCKRNMTGKQGDISSMISLIRLVETNTCLWNFTLKSYFRTDLFSLAWRHCRTVFNISHIKRVLPAPFVLPSTLQIHIRPNDTFS